MFFIYFVLFVVLASVALCVGLVGALVIVPQGLAAGSLYYLWTGVITTVVAAAVALIFLILEKTGHIKLTANLTKNY
ncbi:MAG: hypothetical protein WCL13_01440 [bacterium]